MMLITPARKQRPEPRAILAISYFRNSRSQRIIGTATPLKSRTLVISVAKASKKRKSEKGEEGNLLRVVGGAKDRMISL